MIEAAQSITNLDSPRSMLSFSDFKLFVCAFNLSHLRFGVFLVTMLNCNSVCINDVKQRAEQIFDEMIPEG